MTFGFLLIGAVLLVAAVRDSQAQLFTNVVGDLSGPKNFVYWILAIWVIGAIGYAKPLKGFSDALLALVIIGILVSNKGFFTAFQAQIGSTTAAGGTTTPAAGGLSNPLGTPIASQQASSTTAVPQGLGAGSEAANQAIGF